MKALVQEGYGSPDVLELRDIEMPRVGENEVLVRVHAASVNALDWHMTRGMPYFIRLMAGIRAPRDRVRGVDLAGRVDAVGRNVTQFAPGDEVFGGSDGSFAEYTATKPERLTRKPSGLSYEQASTLYVAALTALQALRDKARLQAGQRVLINGAGGGVGTMAVQIAKWMGAHVTAVTRTESVDMVRSIGADEVIDHRSEDFTRRGERYDVIIYNGGNRPFGECRRVLSRNGALVVVGASAGKWLAPVSQLMGAAVLSLFVSQRIVPFVSKNDRADLEMLAELAQERHIRPVIDRQFPLGEAAEAIRYLGTGHARGKVVITVH